MLGTALCDVVPEKLLLLAGRRLLKRLRVVLNFGADYVDSQIGENRIKQIGSAFLIALDEARAVLVHRGEQMGNQLRGSSAHTLVSWYQSATGGRTQTGISRPSQAASNQRARTYHGPRTRATS